MPLKNQANTSYANEKNKEKIHCCDSYILGFFKGHVNGEMRSKEKNTYLQSEIHKQDKELAKLKNRNNEINNECMKMKNVFNTIQLFCKDAINEYNKTTKRNS